MKTSYTARFETKDEAYARMLMKNQTSRDGTIYCLIDGPENDWAVVDLGTAIEMDALYSWAF